MSTREQREACAELIKSGVGYRTAARKLGLSEYVGRAVRRSVMARGRVGRDDTWSDHEMDTLIAMTRKGATPREIAILLKGRTLGAIRRKRLSLGLAGPSPRKRVEEPASDRISPARTNAHLTQILASRPTGFPVCIRSKQA